MKKDIELIIKNDPAITGTFADLLEILLTYPGLHALWFYRLSHSLHLMHIPVIPRLICNLARFLTGIEIYPGATIKGSIFIDHGIGVVIGPTAIIGKDVLMYSGVVLGSRIGGLADGRGKKRHPTIGNNVLIGTGAKVLGDINVGNNVKIGANAVVLHDIPDNCTAVGVPARIIRN